MINFRFYMILLVCLILNYNFVTAKDTDFAEPAAIAAENVPVKTRYKGVFSNLFKHKSKPTQATVQPKLNKEQLFSNFKMAEGGVSAKNEFIFDDLIKALNNFKLNNVDINTLSNDELSDILIKVAKAASHSGYRARTIHETDLVKSLKNTGLDLNKVKNSQEFKTKMKQDAGALNYQIDDGLRYIEQLFNS